MRISLTEIFGWRFSLVLLFVMMGPHLFAGDLCMDSLQPSATPSDVTTITNELIELLKSQQSTNQTSPVDSNKSAWKALISKNLLQQKRLELEKHLSPKQIESLFRHIQEKLRSADEMTPKNIITTSVPTSDSPASRSVVVFKPQVTTEISGHSGWISSARFSLDHSKLVTASQDLTAKVWNAETGKQLLVLEGHKNTVTSAKFSPSGRYIITNSADNTSGLWDSKTGSFLRLLVGHSKGVTSSAFTPDESALVTSSQDGILKVWNIPGGDLLSTLESHSSWVRGVAMSHQGHLIASASEDKSVKIWNFDSGLVLHTLTDHTNNVNSVAFSPDDTRLVSASSDGSAKVWNTQNGQLVFDLKGHNKNVLAAVFSHDGKLIATAAWDGLVKIWNAHTGEHLYDLKVNAGHLVYDVEFSSDDQKLLTVSDDRVARVWQLYHHIDSEAL